MSIPHCLRCDDKVHDDDGEPHFLIVIEHIILCELEIQGYIRPINVHAADFDPRDGYALCNIEQSGLNHLEIKVTLFHIEYSCARCNIKGVADFESIMLTLQDHLSHD